MKANIRSLKVDLPIDLEELASPLPDGARFNWSELMPKIVVPASVEVAPSSSKPKFPLIRSPLLTEEEWQVAREAGKILPLKTVLEPSQVGGEKASQDVELAGEGD
jgi:hypothetical protein